ncbi:MAG: hypothetical protein AAF436_17910, partial [Myxococcota bacterium]
MVAAFDSLVGKSLEWRGVHHTPGGDFADLSTHTVTYETADHCYVTASGKPAGEASYSYSKMDDRVGVIIYRPDIYQGRTDVVLYAMLDFEEWTDRAVITAGGEPFAVANGTIREV